MNNENAAESNRRIAFGSVFRIYGRHIYDGSFKGAPVETR